MNSPFKHELHDDRWLTVDLGSPHQILSWAVVGGGLQKGQHVVWHRVGNHDLPLDVDPVKLYQSRLKERGMPEDVIGFLTSARLFHHSIEDSMEDGLWVRCLATVGLGNAVRVGERLNEKQHVRVGTINLLLQTSASLSEGAMVEAMSIIAEARTLAMVDAKVKTKAGHFATGTGTDCIALASPISNQEQLIYTGKHTKIGLLIGEATRNAVGLGIEKWQEVQSDKTSSLYQAR